MQALNNKIKHIVPVLAFLLAAAAPHSLALGGRANYLSHGPSAAAFGRGETACSAIGEQAAWFYNPSLLTPASGPAAYLSHFLLYEGSYYSFASASLPVKKFGFAVSALNLRSGDIELRNNIYDLPVVIQTNQSAFMLSFSGELKKHFAVRYGVNAKYLYMNLNNKTAGAIAADAGVSKRVESLKIFGSKCVLDSGISVSNALAPTLTLINDSETYPAIYKAGAALKIPTILRVYSFDYLSVYADLALEENLLNYYAGLEYSLSGMLFLRGGTYKNHYTAGLGYKNGSIQLDYSFDLGPFAGFNKLSLAYLFKSNASKKEIPRLKTKGELLLMKEAKKALKEAEKIKAGQDRDINSMFRSARKDYDNKRYLKAGDKFSEIVIKYPDCESAKEYFEKINSQMEDKSRDMGTSNFEELSYAKGYLNYRRKQLSEAINEWEKVLQINFKRTELDEYLLQAKAFLKDAEKQALEKQAEDAVSALYNDGTAEFDKNNYIACIKKMEAIETLCREKPFAKAVDWSRQAHDLINKCLTLLSKTVAKKTKSPSESEQVQPETEIDTAGADKKYNEGLGFYAQGKLFEAQKAWEIALRMNPAHEKAAKAIDRIQQQ